MNNTLSIKQIFQRFPSLYFERKGDTDDRKFIPTYFLLNFLFQQTGSYQNYIWTMRKNRPPFSFLFVSLFTLQLFFKEEVVLLSVYALSMRNKLALGESHIARLPLV